MDRRQEPCVYGAGKGLEVPEAVKPKAGPGVLGLVAQDGAAGVVGDDSEDAYQPQADRPGLPGAGRGWRSGRAAGRRPAGLQARATIRHQTRLAANPCKGKRSSPVSLAQRIWSPGSGPAAGGAPRDRRADPPSCWWRRRWAGSRPRPRSAAGRPDGAALGARLTRIPLGQAVRSSRSAVLGDVRTIPGLAVSVAGRGPGGLGDGARGSAACARKA